MRIFAPIVAFTFVACSTFAVSARADEATPATAPAEAPPAQVPPPVHSTERSTLKRPTSVEEYDDRLSALRDSVRHGAGAERAAKQAELEQVERWYDEDVSRRGPVLGTGIALLVAGPGLGLGAIAMAIFGGSRSDGINGTMTALGVGAIASVLVGIPLTVIGAQRFVRSPKPQASLVPASLGFTFGPSSVGLQGSF
jgi:hypothetical protein